MPKLLFISCYFVEYEEHYQNYGHQDVEVKCETSISRRHVSGLHDIGNVDVARSQ